MNRTKSKISGKLLIFLAIGIILAISNHPKMESNGVSINNSWDISHEVEDAGYTGYLVETPDFDYSDEDVLSLATTIKRNSKNPYESVKKTVKYVAQNTQYSSAVSAGYCFNEKASTVLKSGVGDCVSMSRLSTALLRAQGIPARTVGGCLSAYKRCAPLFATVPFAEVKKVVMTEGDFKKRGYLHEWVEAWTPEQGWMQIEATSGHSYPLDCNTYLQYAYDTNQYDRCVINDVPFWNECKVY
jgi:transglutaminase-like putative cysteine protease